MRTFLYFALYVFFFFCLTFSAYAETRYISDQLIVTVRSGKGNQYKILETLPTATPVEVLEDDKTYVKVITPKGTEGYIQSHYVSKAPPKSYQITQLKKELKALQQQLADEQQNSQTAQNETNTHKQKITELAKQLDQTRAKLNQTDSDYKALLSKSDNVLNLSTENEKLIEENHLLNSELLLLREENHNFHRSNMIQWFLAGSGVLFLGWLIGKFSRKKTRRF
jgi:SH3 domain protein